MEGGAVRVRPTGLTSSRTRKRYQYQRGGFQPVDFHVHTMPEFLGRPHATFLHCGVEVFVVRDFPVPSTRRAPCRPQ